MKPKLTIDGARQILTHEKGTEPMIYHGGKRPNAGRKLESNGGRASYTRETT